MDWERGAFLGETTFLVAGAASFIGAHLTKALLVQGYRVRGMEVF